MNKISENHSIITPEKVWYIFLTQRKEADMRLAQIFEISSQSFTTLRNFSSLFFESIFEKKCVTIQPKQRKVGVILYSSINGLEYIL
ncbi:MAG: hypothetical protein ACPG5T_08095, partial [Endozoicomonas sp.]